MDRLAELNRLEALNGQSSLIWKRYEGEVPARRINGISVPPMSPRDKYFDVETATKVFQRAALMAADPGGLVFDPTFGTGTTAIVVEQWGQRWITCGTSHSRWRSSR